MSDCDKNKDQPLGELAVLRREVAGLRARAERLATLLAAAPLGIHECDTEGRITFVNPAQAAVTGHAAEELLGTYLWERITPGPERDAMPAYLRQLAEEQPAPTPYFAQNVRKNGDVFDVRVDWNYVRDADGRVRGFVSFVSDVSDHNRAEAARQQTEERYRTLAESTTDIIYIVDRAGVLLYANRSAAERIGVDAAALVGKRQQDLFPPELARAHLQRIARVFETGQTGENDELYRFGPHAVWLNIRSIPLRDDGGRIVAMMGVCRDITERKRAEETLRDSEAKYRRLHQTMRDAFVSVDMHGFIQEYNEAYRQMLGYEDHELPALRYIDVTPAKWHAFEADIVEKQILPRGYSDTYEKEYRRKDGTVFPVELRTFLIANDHGRPAAMWAIVRDITERKRIQTELQQARDGLERRVEERTAELVRANAQLTSEIEGRQRAQEALQASEERYRTVVQDQMEIISRFRADGTFVFVNDVFCRFFGKTAGELLGRKWQPVALAADLPMIEERLQTLSPANPVVTVENRVYSGAGELHWMQFVNRGFFDGNGRLAEVQSVGRDVTGRKAAEEELRQSEERYRGVVEACPDAVVLSDLEGRVVFASRQTWRLLRVPEAEELNGRSIFDYVIEEDRAGLAANLAQLTHGAIRRNTQYTALRADGTTVPVEASSVLIRDPQGRPKLAMAVIRDVTERRQAQAALERERRTLELMLQASDHERRTIAYDIHDGLAQQLAGAIMQFQVYEVAKQSNSEHAAKAYRGGISLLQQGHAEARRIISGVRPPILDESGVVAAIAHLVHDPAVAHGPKVEFHSKAEFGRLPSIFENAIYRIAQEGLTNACKHSQSRKVRISLLQRGDRVRIEIRDWGIGFNPRKVRKNRFGLPGIRERARLLGGKCRIRSAPGAGASIVVDLPLPPELPEEE